ncbi:MAG: GHKL domain-containing protein, partial [Gammaproteobacteria bacterium]|nr:GHKL domain-containing protein [Gammaproteobacteria bacterium]
YQLLNRANTDLATLNTSLEERVAERTEELQSALFDLKESQVQLVQAEKMSSLGQLVAGISHEMNTPLLYLANNAELISERLELFDDFAQRSAAAYALRIEDFEDRKRYQLALATALRNLQASITQDELLASIEEARELLDDSTHGLNDLTEMAQGLKDFSRMDRAPVESFDVNAGLERSLLIARSALKHKANVSKFYGELPQIQCAPSQLNQVFLNLLTNAAQAIDEHGEIVIRTERHDGNHISVVISDTGCGISAENLAKVRDPFFTTKDVGTGTGLGLAIVDQIVTAHGGELYIESEPGKGSAFTIILPINPSGEADLSDDDELLSQLAAVG